MDYSKLDSFSDIKVLVLGDFMLDEYIIGDVKRISPEAPVPVIDVKNREIHLGGAGNVISNIISLKASVRILTCLGDDVAGDYLIKDIKEKKVDTRFVWQIPEEKTIIKTRIVSKGHQFLRYDEERISDVPKAYLEYVNKNLNIILDGINIIIISDYGKGNVTYEMSQLIITTAKSYHIPVVVDPKGSCYEKYAGATVCTPNMAEFIQAVHADSGICEKDINFLGQELCKKIKVEYILVTRSEQGMSLIGMNMEKKDFPAKVEKEVIDVTGAGDTVISVFSLSLASGMSLDDCCKLANQVASIVISYFGTATTTIEEIKKADTNEDNYSKILSLSKVMTIIEILKKDKKKIVFTNGCFDLIHIGHITSLEKAKSYGDILIVGLNSDVSVQRLKGPKRPIIEERQRAKLLSSLSVIDYIVIFDEDTPEKLIDMIIPDVLVKGQDWSGMAIVGEDTVKRNGGRVELIEMEGGLSTTKIIDKIRTLYN